MDQNQQSQSQNPVPQNTPQAPEKNSRIVWILIASSIFIFILIICGVYYFYNQNSSKSQPQSIANQEKFDNTFQVTTPVPTPMPFFEMTIPYLRAREYKSKLGKKEIVFDNEIYTGYLTSYKSDGYDINALLTIPKGEMPVGGWPAVIFIHGYIAPQKYSTLDNYGTYADYISSSGFVILKIDLRGHGNSEGEPGGAYYSSDYIIDTLNARAALQKEKSVDPENIGLWGHSMAGNVVMRSLAARPDIKAAVIWAGAVYTYVDLTEFGIQDNTYQPPPQDSERVKKREKLLKTHGQPEKDSLFWSQVAPANYIKDLKGAIQIHHAVDDSVVSIKYSRNLNKLLADAKVTREFHTYQTGGHNIAGVSYELAMQRTVEFFKKYLEK